MTLKYLLSFSFYCLWCVTLFAKGPIDLKLEALSGQSTSEINPGSAFWRILQADFNDNDQIAFSATLAVPGPNGPRELWGVFLKDGTGVRKVLLEGDRLPGGTEFVVPGSFGSKSGPAFDLNNKGAVAIVDSQRGVFLYQSGSLEWLVRSGSLAPGLAASLSDFAASDRFLNERNQIVFRAKANFFSRSSYGVFLATGGIILQAAVEGDLVPDRPGRRFESASLERSLPSIVADSTVFKSGANSEGLFAFSVTGLRTVAFAGDEVAGVKGKLASIWHFDMNVRGEIAFVAQMKTGEESSFHVLLHSASGVRRVIGHGSPLPGFPGTGATFFSNLSLNNQGELFFAAELQFTKAGFFLWNDGNILKLVLDDEQTPLGGAYRLAVLTGGGFHFPTPLEFRFALTRMNDSREFAFLAEVVDEGGRTGVLFRWRAGLIEPLDFRGLAPDAGGRIVRSLFPLALNQSGKLLLKANLCCDSLTSALYTGKPSAPLTQYLPLVAAGEVAGVEFSTSVELVNHSVFPGFVSLELQHGSGAAFPPFLPRELVVEAGRITSLDLTGGELAVGFLKMTVNGVFFPPRCGIDTVATPAWKQAFTLSPL